MAWGFCAALCLSAVVLTSLGTERRAIDQALLATGRLAFLFFWPAYTGGALVALFGSIFQPLKQRAREFGLAYASVQVVHLGLVGWLCAIGAAPELAGFVFFGVATVATYVLALSSISRVQRMLSPRVWAVLRFLGLNYIAYVFAADFLNDPLSGGGQRVFEYFPFAVVAVAGPGLRLAAFVQRAAGWWRQSRRGAPAV